MQQLADLHRQVLAALPGPALGEIPDPDHAPGTEVLNRVSQGPGTDLEEPVALPGGTTIRRQVAPRFLMKMRGQKLTI